MLSKLKNLSKTKKIIGIIIIAIAVLAFLISGMVDQVNKQKAIEEEQKEIEKLQEAQLTEDEYDGGYTDAMLMSLQPSLNEAFGYPPSGYIWDMEGNLLSLGDKDLSAEEVVYAYLNGLKTLDFSTVQKFSRDSIVVDTYEGYFSDEDKNTDYQDNFIRNMYRQCLLSMQVKEIVNTSVFAKDKQVFTVKINMLDLTQKDFWEQDREEIYKNLRVYGTEQDDNVKSEIYLYDYISRYYSREDAKRRDVTVDITLQKYPDLDTGWLVSIDTDIDSACRYADGTLVVNYINEKYVSEGVDYLNELEAKENASSEQSSSEGSSEDEELWADESVNGAYYPEE